MIRFGVLGCGRIGQVHARNLKHLRGAVVTAVSDAMPAAAEALAAEIGAEVRETDAIVGASDIDALVICTPTDTHADLIEAGAAAGKPVFCEKPIDLDLHRVRACLAKTDAASTLLMIGFQRRFDPHFKALRAAIDDGSIGAIEQVTITSRDPAPPPAEYITRSGGLFRDMTIHDFDMARFLMGVPFTRVLASGTALVDPAIGDLGDMDTATVLLETATGQQVTITNSRRATYGYDQRVEVLGARGMLQVSNQTQTMVLRSSDHGLVQPPLLDFFMDRYKAAYTAEMEAFMDCIRNGTPPPVTGADGAAALELADAAARSAAEGVWVSL